MKILAKDYEGTVISEGTEVKTMLDSFSTWFEGASDTASVVLWLEDTALCVLHSNGQIFHTEVT